MNTTASPERTALVQRLHDALEALERGDESALRNEIDALAGRIITRADLRSDRLAGSPVGYLYE